MRKTFLFEVSLAGVFHVASRFWDRVYHFGDTLLEGSVFRDPSGPMRICQEVEVDPYDISGELTCGRPLAPPQVEEIVVYCTVHGAINYNLFLRPGIIEF